MALAGLGTFDNPYLIGTVDDLVQIQDGTATLRKYYRLISDITIPYRDSRFPNGNKSYIELDGDGHKISGLDQYTNQYSSTAYERWGLFDYVSDVAIRNLGMESFNFYVYAKVGAIAGESGANVSFENCFVRNSFIRAYATTGTDLWRYYGGFVGYARNPITFTNCFVSTLKNGLTQPISASSNAGGFVGYGSGHTFNNCYFIGSVFSGLKSDEGSFTPTTFSRIMTNCYEVKLGSQTSQATVITQDQLKNPSNLVGWDFNNVWGINPEVNDGLPMQRIFLPVLEPPVEYDLSLSSSVKALSSMITWVNAVHPLIKAISINSHLNPISTSYTISLKEVVDRHIKVVSRLNDLETKAKRIQLEKSIGNIVSHLNQITGNYVIVKDIEPEVLDNLTRFLESGNDISFVEHLINNVYLNESRNFTSNTQSKTEVSNLAYTGDTVTLKVQFKTYDDKTIEPTDVKVKIYQPTSTSYELVSTVSLSDTHKIGIGQYEYLYTIPESIINISETKFLVYEFSGMYNGQSTLARGKFTLRFV